MDQEHRPNWRVSHGQRSRAQALRGRSTDAEQLLWSRLRGHRLHGLSFRRQHPIGPYVVDFACLPASLVLEVDGGQHSAPAGRATDERRDRVLADKGLTVLRFSNLDVLQNLTGVLETISAVATGALPPPRPSPASGRGSAAGTGAESPLPLAGEGWEGAERPAAAAADQDKDRHP